MELIIFLVVGVALYFVADWVVERVETAAGRRFELRSFYFFLVLAGLALAAFALVRSLAWG
jgi:hypothetical protein